MTAASTLTNSANQGRSGKVAPGGFVSLRCVSTMAQVCHPSRSTVAGGADAELRETWIDALDIGVSNGRWGLGDSAQFPQMFRLRNALAHGSSCTATCNPWSSGRCRMPGFATRCPRPLRRAGLGADCRPHMRALASRRGGCGGCERGTPSPSHRPATSTRPARWRPRRRTPAPALPAPTGRPRPSRARRHRGSPRASRA